MFPIRPSEDGQYLSMLIWTTASNQLRTTNFFQNFNLLEFQTSAMDDIRLEKNQYPQVICTGNGHITCYQPTSIIYSRQFNSLNEMISCSVNT